eukprot:m.244495 g.244495  ORF g.244495 m.244495 type:complete len:505 (+) comp14462_c0_seq1:31-1545(+)
MPRYKSSDQSPPKRPTAPSFALHHGSSVTATGDLAFVPETPPMKRGPGRPRKYPLPGDGSHAEDKQVFSTQPISAMHVDDSVVLEGCVITDPWHKKYNEPIQIPSSTSVQPIVRAPRAISTPYPRAKFVRPESYITWRGTADTHYELDRIDREWMYLYNQEGRQDGDALDELAMTTLIILFEQATLDAIASLDPAGGVQYDADTLCDVCREPDSETGNEMIFCDHCDVGVHQLCYGVPEIPEGSWYCSPCSEQATNARCCLCADPKGALKPTTQGAWAHMSCALWMPGAVFLDPSKGEPVDVSKVPPKRRSLQCSLCRVKEGACIQCKDPDCTKAFHVTCVLGARETRVAVLPGGVVQRDAYCSRHFPAGEAGQAANSTLYIAQKEFCEYVDRDRVGEITRIAPALIEAVYEYWVQRRRHNGGLPLVRENTIYPGRDRRQSAEKMHLKRKRLTLEKFRSLCELIRRRERVKRELVLTMFRQFSLSLSTFTEALDIELPTPSLPS